MEAVFSYIIGLGAAVMMPIIFTILGVCIGIKFSKALKSGLYVGVGFVGLGVITGLLTSALGPALQSVSDIYDLKLQVFDMGWPAAASVAYNTLVGSFIIPVCLAINLVLLGLGCTKTVNIDLSRFSVKPNAVRTVLSGKLDDENNYDKHPVSPVKSDFKAAKKMTLDIQPRSLEMITIQL